MRVRDLRLFFFPALLLLWLNAIAVEPSNRATETVDLGDGVTMEFVLIQPGSFSMGTANHDYDEKPVHQVTLTQPFYLGKYEVTQAQWEKVMGANPSHFKGAKLPVDNVSWDDCQLFLAALRKKVGKKFALPTEAQWEYACRAGTTTEFSSGHDEALVSDYAWHSGNSNLTTHPVGEKKPNPWGLYDMHGNVYEWCADWYAEAYPGGDAVDPVGPTSGDRRVIRGGAWLYVLDNHRSSDRGFSPPDYRSDEYGLRCAMLLGDRPSTVESETSAPAGSATRTPAEETARLFAQIEAAIADANKLYAEYLLAEVAKLSPSDERMTTLRSKIAALPLPKESLAVDVAAGVRMEFVLIRPGSFMMGSNESPLLNEKPAHRVTITKPFYLGKFEVTQKQWTALMERNLSTFRSTPSRDASQHPVENVSWILAQTFLSRLSEKIAGFTFRLPTEAEWEYACRAGTTGERGVEESALGDYAWLGSNAGGTTHPVGEKKPNAWGLHDLYGNVWEWCQDAYGPYRAESAIDPTGASSSGFGLRVMRGGAWNNVASHVNSTFRHDVGSDVVMRYYGFRCVAEIAPRRDSAK
jgi:formylglycine-generating enzyme required for sulfatase activity